MSEKLVMSNLTTDTNLLSFLPFELLTNSELINLFGSSEITTNFENPIYTSTEDLHSKFNINISHYNNLLTVLHVNTRSLTKNLENLQQLICSLTIQPEIIAITETKLNEKSDLNRVKLNNYIFLHKNSLSCAGGVGIYIKEGIKFLERKDLQLLNETVESMWIKIYCKKKQEITIGVVYRHPNNNINTFTDQFSELLQNLSDEKHSLYITGDFNINVLDKTNKQISNYLSMTKSLNLHNFIKIPTRITKTSSTCIDHFYSNNKKSLYKKFILMDSISDHMPLLCSIKIKCSTKKPEPKLVRNFSKLDSNKLLNETTEAIQNLATKFENEPTDDLNKKFQELTNTLQQTINANAPLEKLSRRKTKINQNQWITDEILRATNLKNKQYKKLIKSNFSDPELHNTYKLQRNKLTRMIKKAKQRHYQKLLNRSNNSSKQTWNVINNLINKKKEKNRIT